MLTPRLRIPSPRSRHTHYGDLLRYHDRLTPDAQPSLTLSADQLIQAATGTTNPWPYLPPPQFMFGAGLIHPQPVTVFPGIDGDPGASFDDPSPSDTPADPQALFAVDDLDTTTLQHLRLPHLDARRSAPGSEHAQHPEIVRQGAGPIARRATLRAHLLRQAVHGTPQVGTLIPDDFRHIQAATSSTPSGGAVLTIIMDSSGSMGTWERRMSKTLTFWATRALRQYYPHVHLLWITHDVKARVLSASAFFARGSSGGTCASQGFSLAHRECDRRYPLTAYHRYVIYLSDGGNLHSDNHPALASARALAATCTGFFLGELHESTDRTASPLYKAMQSHSTMRLALLYHPTDILPTLQTWFRP